MSMAFDSKEDLYLQMEHLQRKLKESEEERNKLEKRCNLLMRAFKEEEKLHYNALNNKYETFLEDCRYRRKRNDIILRSLCRVEDKARVLYAKTERLKLLKDHYITYLKQSNLQHEVELPRPLKALSTVLPKTQPSVEVPAKSVHWKSPSVADYIDYTKEISNIDDRDDGYSFLRSQDTDKSDVNSGHLLYEYLRENIRDGRGSNFDKWGAYKRDQIDRNYPGDHSQRGRFVEDKSGIGNFPSTRPSLTETNVKSYHFEKQEDFSENRTDYDLRGDRNFQYPKSYSFAQDRVSVPDKPQVNPVKMFSLPQEGPDQSYFEFAQDEIAHGGRPINKFDNSQINQARISHDRNLENMDKLKTNLYDTSLNYPQNFEISQSETSLRERSLNRCDRTQMYPTKTSCDNINNAGNFNIQKENLNPDCPEIRVPQSDVNVRERLFNRSDQSQNSPTQTSFLKKLDNANNFKVNDQREDSNPDYSGSNDFAQNVVTAGRSFHKSDKPNVSPAITSFSKNLINSDRSKVNLQRENLNQNHSKTTEIAQNKSEKPQLNTVKTSFSKNLESAENFKMNLQRDLNLDYAQNIESKALNIDSSYIPQQNTPEQSSKFIAATSNNHSSDSQKQHQNLSYLDYSNEGSENNTSVLNDVTKASALRQRGVVKHQESIDKLKKALSIEEEPEKEDKESESRGGSSFRIVSDDVDQKIVEKEDFEISEKEEHSLKYEKDFQSHSDVGETSKLMGGGHETSRITNDDKQKYFVDEKDVENKTQPSSNEEDISGDEPPQSLTSLPMGLDGVDYQEETYPESYYEQPVHHHDYSNIVSNVILEEDESELDAERLEENNQNISINLTQPKTQQVFDNNQTGHLSSQWSPIEKNSDCNEPFSRTKHDQEKSTEFINMESRYLNNKAESEDRESVSHRSSENQEAFDGSGMQNEEVNEKLTPNNSQGEAKNITNVGPSNLVQMLESDSESFQIEHPEPASGNEDSDFDFSFRQN